MATLPLEKLEVFQAAEELADSVWDAVVTWKGLAQHTVGEQLVCAADSVGANIAEGFGRGSYGDNKRFVKIARGSLYETRFWLRRAHRRNLLSKEAVDALQPLLKRMGPLVNGYLRSIGKANKIVTNDE